MKNKIALICILLFAFASHAQSAFLKVASRSQEKINWSWAATSQSILDAYGVYKSQAEIAEYGTPGGMNTISGYGNGLYIDGTATRSVKSILEYFKGISSVPYARALTMDEVKANIDAGRIVIASRISGIVIIYGYNRFTYNGITTNSIYYIQPWPGYGTVVEDYTTFANGNGYPWTASLVLTTPIGTRPSRPIPEPQVSKIYGLYAFNQLSMSSGSKCYADATTTTNYCRIGSGWFPSLENTDGTKGITLGENSFVGNALSNGPVVLIGGSNVTGTLYMRDLNTLTRYANAQVGSIVQHNVGYVGFGYGTVDNTNTPKTTVVIPANQPRRNLTPGYYWNYTIQSNSPVRLTAGDYHFSTLKCESCTMEIDASQGPVRIYVSWEATWTGTLNYVSGGPEKLLFTYLGTNAFPINGILNGTVLAPNATMTLGLTNKYYKGMYTAKKITVSQNTEVRWVPFAHYTSY